MLRGQVALYVSMGAGGYYLFGTSVSSDILVSFPLDDPSIIVGRVAVSFVAAVSPRNCADARARLSRRAKIETAELTKHGCARLKARQATTH